MLAELARTRTLADPLRFPSAHRRAVAGLETLARHGLHGSRAAGALGPLKNVVRWLIQLVARYLVISYLRSTAIDLRNLYWLREIETESPSPDRAELRRARYDAEGLVTIFKRREIGLPSFVIGGLLIPVFATGWRVANGVAFEHWWGALATGLVTALFVAGGLGAPTVSRARGASYPALDARGARGRLALRRQLRLAAAGQESPLRRRGHHPHGGRVDRPARRGRARPGELAH